MKLGLLAVSNVCSRNEGKGVKEICGFTSWRDFMALPLEGAALWRFMMTSMGLFYFVISCDREPGGENTRRVVVVV